MPPLIVVFIKGIANRNKRDEVYLQSIFITDRAAWSDTDHTLTAHRPDPSLGPDQQDRIFLDLTYCRLSVDGEVLVEWSESEEDKKERLVA